MVSVIINTKNEGKNISRCLGSLRDQNFRDFEVIVVDNNSTDNTKDASKNFGARVYDFGPERSEQKNFGVQKAIGEYLLFVDADMELTPGVIDSCIEKIKTGCDAVVIPEESRGTGFWSECRSLEKKMYFNDSEIEAPRFFRKGIFERVEGFSAGMIAGEDWDLREKIKKISVRVGRIEDLIYHHEGRVALSNVLKKKFYYGRNSRIFLSKNKPALFRFLFRPSYWKNIRYLFSDPAHFLGMVFLKILDFGAGFLGFVFAKRVRP